MKTVAQEPVLHLALQHLVPVHGDVRVPEELGPGLLAEPPLRFGGGRGQPSRPSGVGERLGPASTVVTLLVDSDLKYLSTDAYRQQQGS